MGQVRRGVGGSTHSCLPFPCSFSLFTALTVPAGSALPQDPEGHVYSSLPTCPPWLSGSLWLLQPLMVHTHRSRVAGLVSWFLWLTGPMGVGLTHSRKSNWGRWAMVCSGFFPSVPCRKHGNNGAEGPAVQNSASYAWEEVWNSGCVWETFPFLGKDGWLSRSRYWWSWKFRKILEE